MKKVTACLLTAFLVACGGGAADKKDADTTAVSIKKDSDVARAKQEGKTWIENFRIFRDAVYQKNKEKVKLFFDFPVMNTNNEIWYLVNDSSISDPDKIRPFTEKNFDWYYDKLFPEDFIKAMLKIKTEELYKTGEVQTPSLSSKDSVSYVIYATYDKSNNSLSLNMAFNSMLPEGEDGGEYNVLYFFVILPDGQLKFKEIRIAG